MSHTDVHRPYWVQVADPYARKHFYLFQSRPHQHELWPLRNLCGCRMCVGTLGRKYKRRRERAQWRQDRQALLAGGEMRPERNLEVWL